MILNEAKKREHPILCLQKVIRSDLMGAMEMPWQDNVFVSDLKRFSYFKKGVRCQEKHTEGRAQKTEEKRQPVFCPALSNT